MGTGVKVSSAAMEVDSDFKMFSVPKATGHFLDCLDSRVKSFTHRIGDSMLQVSQNIPQVFTKHPSHLLDGLQPGTNSPGIPGLKVFGRPAQRLIAPQLPEALFDSPGSSRLQPLLLQPGKHTSLFRRKVFLRIRPKILSSSQHPQAFFLQLPMLLLTDHIYCLNQVRHQMIAAKYQLFFRSRHLLPNRGQIRVPNISSNSINLLPLSQTQQAKIPIQTLFPASSAIYSTLASPRS